MEIFKIFGTPADDACKYLDNCSDNSFAITRISPLWAGLIGVCTFIAALLLTSKR